MLKKENISNNFQNIKFFDKVFYKFNFWNSEFKNAKFINCKFKNCIFADVKFIKVVFDNCEISNCNFQHASFLNSKINVSKSKNNLVDDIKVDKSSQLTNNFFRKKVTKDKNEEYFKLNKVEQEIYNSLTKGKGYIIIKDYYPNNKINKAYKILNKIVLNDKKIKGNKKIFERNKRMNQKWVRSLINIDPIFSEFLLPEVVKKVFSKLIGEDFICGSYAANCLLPGARGQDLHIDYPHSRFVTPGKNLPYQKQKDFYLNLQIITPLTAFTKNNGTTAIVENSHNKNRFPDKFDIKKSKIKLMEMEPGSVLIYNGLLWHGATPNFSKKEKRYGIVAQYMPNYIVPMEDLMKITSKKLVERNKTIQNLFGFNLEFPAVYKS